MDTTEDIQKLVGKLVIDNYLQNKKLYQQILSLTEENNGLKESLKLLQGQIEKDGQ